MNLYDKESIKTASDFFSNHGFTVEVTSDPYAPFDLVCSKPGFHRFAVEVKGRTCSINAFDTMRTDRLKYEEARAAIERGEYKGILVASVYPDGMGIGDISLGQPATAYGPKTTCFYNQSRIEKEYWDTPFLAKFALPCPEDK